MNLQYTVSLRPAARRDLDRFSSDISDRILSSLSKLEQNPRPHGCKKLTGQGNQWRLRVGDYRVLYEIDDEVKIVRIFRIRHRREAYR